MSAERRNTEEEALFDERFFGPGQAALVMGRRGSGLDLRRKPEATENPGLHPQARTNPTRSYGVGEARCGPVGLTA